jgi:hypothetical protein
MTTVLLAMMTLVGASCGSLQVFSLSPSRAAFLPSNRTVALPSSTVP